MIDKLLIFLFRIKRFRFFLLRSGASTKYELLVQVLRMLAHASRRPLQVGERREDYAVGRWVSGSLIRLEELHGNGGLGVYFFAGRAPEGENAVVRVIWRNDIVLTIPSIDSSPSDAHFWLNELAAAIKDANNKSACGLRYRPELALEGIKVLSFCKIRVIWVLIANYFRGGVDKHCMATEVAPD